MANYYEQFSKILPLDAKNPKELEWWQKVLATQNDHGQEGPIDVMETGFDIKITEDPPSVWLYCDQEGSDSGQAAEAIHQFLKHFDLPDIITISVACWCSKPWVDEQSGHIHVISKEGWESGHLWTLGADIEKAIKDGRPKPQQKPLDQTGPDDPGAR